MKRSAFVVILGSALSASILAQAPATPLITRAIDESKLVTLHGNVHPLANARYDQGQAPDSTPANRMLLVLRRSPEREVALQQYVDDIHRPDSANFHHWLKPSEVGTLYGTADEDVQQVSQWLSSHGFSVNGIHPGKTVIEFSGTAGQIHSAFHTEIHRYNIDGELHIANNGEPQIPEALTPVIAGFASLNDFRPKPNLISKGKALYSPATHAVTPQWTDPASGGGVYFALAPGDFNLQYDVGSGHTGAGYTIGIIGASNVDVGLVNSYRTLFGLPSNPPQVVIDGEDPGQNGAEVESYLDLEVAGAVAPGATVVLYTSADSALTSGLFTAAQRAVDDDTADVLSMSYGECESVLGVTNQFYYQLWQQAAAQGQTVMVSAGDGGAAGCDNFDSETIAMDGLAVNGFASTPYNIAVGGTDFYYSAYNQGSSALNAQIATYWNTTSSRTPSTSLLKTIPEQPWNDPFGLNTTTSSHGFGIVAGSGGSSSLYGKPAWQSGTGVPSDGARDLPDVSLFASSGVNYSFWPICAISSDCTTDNSTTGAVNIFRVGGTSASSPAFAGVMALVDQATGSRQGQANYVLYPLAAQFPSVFHDVTAGSNKVPCEASTNGCALDANFGVYDLGYYATSGYDMASGLGTLDVSALIANWNAVSFKSTNTTLSLNPSSITHGQSVTVSAGVTPASGSGTPTGTLALTGKATGATTQTGLGVVPLVAGSANAAIESLPGGSYTVTADYSGDNVYAASHSAGSSITVQPEASVIQFPAAELTAYNNQTLPLGRTLYILAQVAGTSGVGVPTGSVTFTDSVKGPATFPLNSTGMAEWNIYSLAMGNHTISVSYSGDASFKATTTPATMSFTIGKGSVYGSLIPSATSVPASGSLTAQISLYGMASTPPTGTVTATFGGQSQTATLAPISASNLPASNATVVFNNIAAGSSGYIYLTYSGDANWNSVPSSMIGNFINVLSSAPSLTTNTTLTTSSISNGYNGEVTVTGKVSGNGVITPTGYVVLYTNFEGEMGIANLTASGTSATYTASISSAYFVNGSNQMTAVYNGDSNYLSSASLPLTVTTNIGDFALNALTPVLSVAPGSSVTENLMLTSYGAASGVTGAVTIQCTTSSPAIVCSPASTSTTLTVSSQTATSVTIQAYTTTASNVIPASGLPRWISGGAVLSCLVLLWIPGKYRARRMLCCLLLLIGTCFVTSCGGGDNSSSSGPGSPSTINAAPGTYYVVVTAVANSMTHSVRLTVNVQ
jgi:subtilase family serine protease